MSKVFKVMYFSRDYFIAKRIPVDSLMWRNIQTFVTIIKMKKMNFNNILINLSRVFYIFIQRIYILSF